MTTPAAGSMLVLVLVPPIPPPVAAPSARSDLPTDTVDLLVVGAGVVGLAHAVEGHLRGLKVAVVERDAMAVGASVRNFGHACITPQTGLALTYALAARERWLALSAQAGFPVLECGTVVVARHEDELAVLEQFADERGPEMVRLLTADGVRSAVGELDEAVVGGVHLPLDLRTDPRVAVAAIATWLEAQGVPISWRTTVGAVEPGVVTTSRGRVRARQVVVAVGHDVDRLFPDAADAIGLQRCRLQMLQVAVPGGRTVEPAVLTGTSMLRYDGLSQQPAAAAVRDRLRARAPELLESVVNLMFTQRPEGDLVLGDTHHYGLTHPPFDDERLAELLLTEGARLLGVPRLAVTHRWRGVYASSAQTDFLDTDVADGVRVVSVTSGIGMTTAHGLAAAVLDSLV